MMEVKSNDVKSILHRNLECLVHKSRQIGNGQIGDGKSEHPHLGIRELKLTGIGVFNSDDHYVYYCGQESLEEVE